MKNKKTIIEIILFFLILSSCQHPYDGSESSAESVVLSSFECLTSDVKAEDPLITENTANNSETARESETIESMVADTQEIDWNNPQLSDLFDVDLIHRMDDDWLLYIGTKNISFETIVSFIGKPHGFRPGHPDTLVWMSNTGTAYGIRFTINDDHKKEFKNAVDQFWHSISAFNQTVYCDMESAYNYQINELPIKDNITIEYDHNASWQEQFFDLNHNNLLSDEQILEFHSPGMYFEDVVSFLGKPHAILLSGSGITNALVWMSNSGNYYFLVFNDTNCNPYQDLFPRFSNKITVRSSLSHPSKLTGDFELFDDYLLRRIS